MARRIEIAAHEVATFEVWLGDALAGTEAGYGRDHDGAELAPVVLEQAA